MSYNTSFDLISLFCSFAYCCIPLLFLIGVFYLIFRRKTPEKKDTQSTTANQNTNNILGFLKTKKAEGITTIDELIAELETSTQTNLEIPKPKQVIDSTIQSKPVHIEQIQKHIPEKESKPSISSAEVLLYLGSFLITFAMLVLVALGWEAIPGIVKAIILIVTVLAFLIGGLLLVRNEKLKNVGLTYLSVASIGTPLAFLGIWNFLLSETFNNQFNLYWTIVSIIIVALNAGILQFTSKKRFFYLMQISIYSLIISFAFTLTNDTNFRIVIIATLNLVFYLSEKIFGLYSKDVKIVSRIINSILNVLILLTVFGLVNDINTDYQRILASIAMLIPTAFITLSHIKEKAYFESGVEFVLFVFKLLLISILFLKGNEQYFLIIFSALSLIYIFFGEFNLKKISKALFYEVLIIAGGILAYINLILLVNWFAPESLKLNLFTVLSSLIATLVGSIFIPFKNKNYSLAGLGLTYSIFFISRLISYVFTGSDLRPYIYTYLILGTLIGGVHIYSKLIRNNGLYKSINIISELLMVFAGLFGLLTFNTTEISVVFLSLTAFYFTRSLILKDGLVRGISYALLFIGFTATMDVISRNNIISIIKPEHYSLALLVPSVTFFVITEAKRYFKLYYTPEEFGVALFAGIGLLLSITDKNVLWINILVIFIYSLIRFGFSLRRVNLISTYILGQILLVLGLNILNRTFEDGMWVITSVNMITLLVSAGISFASRREISPKVKSLIDSFSYCSLIWSILITLLAFTVNENILWFNLFSLFIYSIIKLAELKSREVLLASFALLQLLVLVSAYILKIDYIGTLIAIAITNLILASFTILSNSIEFTDSNSKIINLLKTLNVYTIVYTAFIIFAAYFGSFINQSWLYSIVLILSGLTIITSNNNNIRKLAGIPFVLAIWNANALNDVNAQLYIVPLTIYGLILAGLSYMEGKNKSGEGFEVSAYGFQMLTLLVQSITASTEMERIIIGLILIVLSVILTIIGVFRGKRSIWITSIIFLVLELIIRLYIVIQLIPWWAYVGLIGFVLIGLASFIIYRSSASNK